MTSSLFLITKGFIPILGSIPRVSNVSPVRPLKIGKRENCRVVYPENVHLKTALALISLFISGCAYAQTLM